MIPKEIDKHFRVLGLDSGATFAQVKEARQWYTKAFHPDRFPPNSSDAHKATEKQKDINEAYEQIQKWFQTGSSKLGSNGSENKHQKHSDGNWVNELNDYLDHFVQSVQSLATLRNTESDLKTFANWLYSQELSSSICEIGDRKTITRYARSLSTTYSPATIARHLYSIRGWLAFERMETTFIVSLASQYKAYVKPKVESLTDEELREFLNGTRFYLDVEEQTMINLLVNTGLTAGEICRLSWNDVHLSGKQGPLLSVAGRSRSRLVPLNELATKALTSLKRRRTRRSADGYLFVRAGVPFTPKMVHYAVDRCAREVDIRVTPSILRHTFAKRLTAVGVLKRHLAHLLGITEQSASIYYPEVPLDTADLAKAVAKIKRT